jgi:Ca2+-dependent lipid-binding protein
LIPLYNSVFSKFTLGFEPPVLVSVKAVDETPNEIGLDIDFKWATADPAVQLNVSVLGVVGLYKLNPVVTHSLKPPAFNQRAYQVTENPVSKFCFHKFNLYRYSAVFPIALERVEAFGCIRIVFGPLCEWWPTFSAMQVAFIGKPQINFNLRLIGGDITTVPFVEKLLTNLIKNVLVNLMVGLSLPGGVTLVTWTIVSILQYLTSSS